MRHTTTTAAAVAVLLLALTACSSSNDGDGGGDGKAGAKHSPSQTADPSRAYLAAAHRIEFTSRRPDDAELTAFPPKWCAGLDGGHSTAWLFSGGGGNLYPNGMDWGTVKKNANELLVAGVKAYCPKHTDTVTEELRASGAY